MSPRTMFHPLLARFGVKAIQLTHGQRYSFSVGIRESHGVLEERAVVILGGLLWDGAFAYLTGLGPEQQLEIVEVAGQLTIVEPRFATWQDAIRGERARTRLNQGAASVIAGVWLEIRRDCDEFGRRKTKQSAA